jgi:hypothetical protein
VRSSCETVALETVEQAFLGHVPECEDGALVEGDSGDRDPHFPIAMPKRQRSRSCGRAFRTSDYGRTRGEVIPAGNGFGGHPSHHVVARDASNRRSGRIPEADDAAPIDQRDSVPDELERLHSTSLPLDFAVNACVVDRGGGAVGELLHEEKIVLVVTVPRRARPERDRPERTPVCDEWNDEIGEQIELVIELEVFVVKCRGCEDLLGHLLDQNGLPASQAARRGMRLITCDAVAATQLVQNLLLLWINVGENDLAEGSAILNDVEQAKVGERRDRETSEFGKRAFVVQRLIQKPAGVRHEAGALLGPPAFRDVMKDVDGKDAPVRAEDRGCLHDRPPLFAGRLDSVAEGRFSALRALEHATTWQVIERERLAVLAENLEAPKHFGDRSREKLVG